jgi:hypothetical protein
MTEIMPSTILKATTMGKCQILEPNPECEEQRTKNKDQYSRGGFSYSKESEKIS